MNATQKAKLISAFLASVLLLSGCGAQHSGRRTGVPAPAPSFHIDESRIGVAFRSAYIPRRRGHGGISGRVHRQDDGRCCSRIAADLSRGIDLTGECTVLVFRGRHISAGYKDPQVLIFGGGWSGTIDNARLPVNIVLRVVLPVIFS